ncbi:MAG: hypothetical protein K2K80_00030 [Clostridia bacterium]|nr:hypothetical protein [Clostridia bacterium]
MTPTDLDNWISKINGFDIKYIDESADNYLFSADVYGKEETFFILHAEKTGEYRITLKYDEDDNGNPVIVKDDSYGNYIVKFYVNGSFGQENENMRLEGNGNGGIRSQILSMTAGDDFIFSVSSIDGREHYSVDFVMAYANMPSTTPASGDETYTLTYADIDEAILSFTPDKSGKYKITSLSDENDPKIIVYSAGTNSPIYNEDGTPMGDDNSGDGNNFSYTENVQQQHIGITYYYHIFINKTATTRLDVKIERIGNADEDPEVVTDIAKVEATLVKQSKQQGTWTPLAQENKVVEKNGEYFVTVNGIEYKVYAAITKNLGGAEYSFATIESMGPEDVRPGDNGSSSSDGKKNDYLTVYELNSSTQRYNYTDFIKTYSEYCDEADGVYPLNGELKLFIERYMANHWADIVDEPDAKNPPSNMLALACGYFA